MGHNIVFRFSGLKLHNILKQNLPQRQYKNRTKEWSWRISLWLTCHIKLSIDTTDKREYTYIWVRWFAGLVNIMIKVKRWVILNSVILDLKICCLSLVLIRGICLLILCCYSICIAGEWCQLHNAIPHGPPTQVTPGNYALWISFRNFLCFHKNESLSDWMNSLGDTNTSVCFTKEGLASLEHRIIVSREYLMTCQQ